MHWFIYAIGAPVLWAMVNIADHYLVKKSDEGDNPVGSLVIFSSIIGLFVALAIFLFSNSSISISGGGEFILILAGIVNALWIILYLYALSADELSVVYPWFLTIPFFAYIFGYFFLGETLTQLQIIGGVIVCLGGVIISLEPAHLFAGRLRFKRQATLCMLSAAILAALGSVLFKFVAEDAGFWASSFWEYLGLGVAGVIIFVCIATYRHGFFAMLKNGGMQIFTINATSELATVAGNLLFRFATLLAPIALVSLVEPIQSVIVFAFAVVGTIFFPHIIKEDISKQVLMYKITAIAIMFFGSILLFRG